MTHRDPYAKMKDGFDAAAADARLAAVLAGAIIVLLIVALLILGGVIG